MVLGSPARLAERIEDDQAALPPLVRRDHVARCRGIRRLLREPGRPHASSIASTARSTCAAGATTTRTRVVVAPGDEPSLVDDGVAHLERRGARRGRQARRGRRHRGRVVRRPRDRPRLPLHRPVGSHADPALGRRARARHRGRQRVDLPRPPEPPQQGRRRPAPARPRHDRHERRRRVRRRGTATCSASASWPSTDPRRGADLGVLGAHDEREVARPRRRARRLDAAPVASTTTRSGSTPARSC